MKKLVLWGLAVVTVGCASGGKDNSEKSADAREPSGVAGMIPKKNPGEFNLVQKSVYGVVEVDSGTIVQFRKANQEFEGVKQDVILVEQCRPFANLANCNPVRVEKMPYDSFVNRIKLLVRTGGFASFTNPQGSQTMVSDAMKGADPRLVDRTRLMAEQRAEWMAEAERMEKWLQQHGVTSTKVSSEIGRLKTLISDRTKEIQTNDELIAAADALDRFVDMIMSRVVDPKTEYLLVNGRDNSRIEYYLLTALREPAHVSSQFAKISAGSFQRYSAPTVGKDGQVKPGELLGTVELSSGFEISTTEITQYDFLRLMAGELRQNPAKFKAKNDCRDHDLMGDIELCPLNPIENITRADVERYIQILNQNDKHFNYRLPTEAEWELAARGGSMGRYTFNAQTPAEMDAFAWTQENAVGISTLPVALKARNNSALYDVHGNVAEVVERVFDCGSKKSKKSKKGTDVFEDPKPCGENEEVARGGAFDMAWDQSTLDVSKTTYLPSPSVGFRLVRIRK